MNGMIDGTPFSTPYDQYEEEEDEEFFDEVSADDERAEKELQ